MCALVPDLMKKPKSGLKLDHELEAAGEGEGELRDKAQDIKIVKDANNNKEVF